VFKVELQSFLAWCASVSLLLQFVLVSVSCLL